MSAITDGQCLASLLSSTKTIEQTLKWCIASLILFIAVCASVCIKYLWIIITVRFLYFLKFTWSNNSCNRAFHQIKYNFCQFKKSCKLLSLNLIFCLQNSYLSNWIWGHIFWNCHKHCKLRFNIFIPNH